MECFQLHYLEENLRSAAKYTSCPRVFLTLYLFSVSHPVRTVSHGKVAEWEEGNERE